MITQRVRRGTDLRSRIFLVNVCTLASFLFLCVPVNAVEIGKPHPITPANASPRFPAYAWTAADNATSYVVRVYSVPDLACNENEVTIAGPSPAIAIVDSVIRCREGTCQFDTAPGSRPIPGVVEKVPIGYIHRARECQGPVHTGPLHIWRWSVQGTNGSQEGPTSEEVSFWLQESAQ